MDKRKTVLVVDDEAPVRRILELKLKNGGYDVILAEDGEAGLRVIENEKPDAVVYPKDQRIRAEKSHVY